MQKNKVLIIRFSSFGDIVQCSGVVEYLRRDNPDIIIDWVTRSDFIELVKLNKNINQIYSISRNDSFVSFIKLCLKLRKNKYDFVYDAHNNLRSNILKIIFKLTFNFGFWMKRSKDRFKRILLFIFKINLFPRPFKGIDSFIRPLEKVSQARLTDLSDKIVNYQFPKVCEEKILNLIDKNKMVITLVPSAAWEMKRWPLEHFKKLIVISENFHFYILGGKEDIFCEELKLVAPLRVTNLAGKLSLIESCCFVNNSQFVISADTGLLHVADVLGIKAFSLMGPTAFGFTRSEKIKTMQVDLNCRPCSKDGRGKCSQDIYKKCMVSITPENILKELLVHFPQ